MSLLALFVMLTTSYERTRRLLGALAKAIMSRSLRRMNMTVQRIKLAGCGCAHTHTAGREETVRRPLSVGEWINMLAIPVLGADNSDSVFCDAGVWVFHVVLIYCYH